MVTLLSVDSPLEITDLQHWMFLAWQTLIPLSWSGLSSICCGASPGSWPTSALYPCTVLLLNSIVTGVLASVLVEGRSGVQVSASYH